MDDQHRSAGEDGLGRPAEPDGSPWSRPSDAPPESGYPTERYDRATAPIRPAAFGSPAYAEPGFPGAPEDDGRGRRVGRFGIVVAGVCLLVIGLGGGYLVASMMGFGDTDPGRPPAAAPAGNASAQSTPPTQSPQSTQPREGDSAPAPGPGMSGLPLGSIGSGGSSASGGGTGADGSGANAALGVVASIDGDRFVVRTLDGDEDRVSTDRATYIVTVRGTGGISKLAVGDLVFVGGTSRSDGSIKADMVLGGAFPDVGAGP